MLGRTSASCKFCVPRVSDSTSTRSPPTASVSDFKSGIVVTTRTLSAACALVASAIAPATATKRRNHCVGCMRLLLERMRRMGAENERGLEEDLVDVPRGRLVVRESRVLASLRELVAQTESQELRRKEADVRLDRLLAAAYQLLRVVVARTARPAPERLQLAVSVPAEARERPVVAERDRGLGNTVAVRVDQEVVARGFRTADRPDAFTARGDERVQPAFRAVLVADVEARQRTALSFRRVTIRDRCAELDRVLVAKLEECPHAPHEHRLTDAAASERRVVVTVARPTEDLERS